MGGSRLEVFRSAKAYRRRAVLAVALAVLVLVAGFAVSRMGFTAIGSSRVGLTEEELFYSPPVDSADVPGASEADVIARAGTWKQVGDEWYCEASDGTRQTGWVKDGEYRYYLRTADDEPTPGPEGSMVVGWAKLGAYWFYFDPDGAMHKGRLAYDGHEYYMCDENVTWYIHGSRIEGSMLTGLVGFGRPSYFAPYSFVKYYCEGPCLQLFQTRSFPEGALVEDCSFVDWGMFTLGNGWSAGNIDGLGNVQTEHSLRFWLR
ncbi:N-acetylmuramoyl-L-alanine amidase family protein [Adlercreutzia aquisgranensis]|uniref:N-acetylmuramoyl-L-alanine amidase family protein n=1 Tax=Adlercreutzia aquisgranensis TaxID=2941323 RepID=UPI002041A099|nr:hypothetical protein [Adlercreutzia aquisgranensis]